MNHSIDTIKSYYEANLGKDLPDYSLLGWESEEAQKLRFEMVASHVPLEGKRILDVGCGVGNFAEYLVQKGIRADYTGVDILESMISRARQKNLNARFLHCDLFKENPLQNEKFDAIYASGIFNLDLHNNMEFLRKAVGTFLSLSDGIVAFNLLSSSSLDKEEGYFYYDMDEVKELIRREFPQEIRKADYYNGYLHNDFTVICSKEENEAPEKT